MIARIGLLLLVVMMISGVADIRYNQINLIHLFYYYEIGLSSKVSGGRLMVTIGTLNRY